MMYSRSSAATYLRININQIFHYARCIKLKRVHFRVITPAGNKALFEEMSQKWQTVGNSVSNLTGSRFKS